MNKDRLGAFMDAVIAIVMTILVLELVLAPGEKGHSESGEKGQLPVG